MNNYESNKIQKFTEDNGMSLAVFNFVKEQFCNNARNTKDVQLLATNMLAIVFLEKAWSELDRYKAIKEEQKSTLTQVGL